MDPNSNNNEESNKITHPKLKRYNKQHTPISLFFIHSIPPTRTPFQTPLEHSTHTPQTQPNNKQTTRHTNRGLLEFNYINRKRKRICEVVRIVYFLTNKNEFVQPSFVTSVARRKKHFKKILKVK